MTSDFTAYIALAFSNPMAYVSFHSVPPEIVGATQNGG